MVEQVVWNKSILLQKIQMKNTQTLQLITINIKQKLFTKVIKNAKQILGLRVLSREGVKREHLE
jgi:hypothetical protein